MSRPLAVDGCMICLWNRENVYYKTASGFFSASHIIFAIVIAVKNDPWRHRKSTKELIEQKLGPLWKKWDAVLVMGINYSTYYVLVILAPVVMSINSNIHFSVFVPPVGTGHQIFINLHELYYFDQNLSSLKISMRSDNYKVLFKAPKDQLRFGCVYP